LKRGSGNGWEAGNGNCPPIQLVWEIEVLGTFCGKNIFGEAEIKKASTYICTESGVLGTYFGKIFWGSRASS
jgi:hypothetical protein